MVVVVDEELQVEVVAAVDIDVVHVVEAAVADEDQEVEEVAADEDQEAEEVAEDDDLEAEEVVVAVVVEVEDVVWLRCACKYREIVYPNGFLDCSRDGYISSYKKVVSQTSR